MFDKVYPHIWMALPIEIRAQLVKDFDIQRTGRTEIVDQTVVSDGYTLEDLKAISLEKMNAYIGSEETQFPHAWLVTCSKATGIVYPPINIPQPEQALSQSPIEDLKKELEKPIVTTTSNAIKNKKSKQD